MLVTTQGNIHC